MHSPRMTDASRAAPNRRWIWRFAAAATTLLAAGAAVAQLVPESQCHPRPCTCADLPTIDRFAQATAAAETAWEKVLLAFSGNNPPRTLDEARALFDANNPADPLLLQEGRKGCPTFGGGKIGGIDDKGNPVYDSCYCQAFCDVIVLSTGDHERRHHENMVDIALQQIPVVLAGGLLGESVPYNASVLTLSEIDAHEAQLKSLADRKAALIAANPDDPACSGQAPGGGPPVAATISSDAGLGERLRALWQRFSKANSR